MNQWIDLDKLASWKKTAQSGRVDLKKVMEGEEGLKRVQQYKVPMAAGLMYSYAAKLFVIWLKRPSLLPSLKSCTTVL